MKVEELDPELLIGYPRYIGLQRFAELVGLADNREILMRWIDTGNLPVRRIGNHLLVDLQTLAITLKKERAKE